MARVVTPYGASTSAPQFKRSRLPLGDAVEALVHPFAVALHLPCLDKKTQHVRPDSPCGHRKQTMNDVGDKIAGAAVVVGQALGIVNKPNSGS